MLGFKRTAFEKNANEPSWVSCQLSFLLLCVILYKDIARNTIFALFFKQANNVTLDDHLFPVLERDLSRFWNQSNQNLSFLA